MILRIIYKYSASICTGAPETIFVFIVWSAHISANDNAKVGKNLANFGIMIWQGRTTEGNEPIHQAQNNISLGNIIVSKK